MSNSLQNFENPIRTGKIVNGMSFDQKVWALTSRIEKGRVATYGDLARALGGTAFRAVGAALRKNPYAPGVPCHRVVASDGRLNGYAGGLPKKQRMLEAEGVSVKGGRVDLALYRKTVRNHV